MPEELRYDPATGSWTMPAHWAEDTTGLSAELDRRIAARQAETVWGSRDIELCGWIPDRRCKPDLDQP